MPLISAQNLDVLDVANIEDDDNSSLLRRPTLTLSSAQDDVLSVMTIHSAFQGGIDSAPPTPMTSTGNVRIAFKPDNLNSFFSWNRQDNIKIDEHDNIASKDASMNSIPIQQCDMAIDEQSCGKAQEPTEEPISTTKNKKFSTQMYSDRGTVQSSFRRQVESTKSGDQSSETKSIATATVGDNSFVQNSSKSRGAARLLSPRPHTSKGSRRSSASSTKDETVSVVSQKTSSSSHQKSESKLSSKMFRLSVELANTLAILDIANSEAARSRKQCEDLQETVEKMQIENEVLKIRLGRYEQKTTMSESKPPLIEVRKSELIPACVTTSKGAVAVNQDNGPIFSPITNSSFSDPAMCSREDGELLFPDLNGSHISCPGLYKSRVQDEFGIIMEEEDEVDDIDPRDEIFNDDPFATCFNYSNESSVNESKEEDKVDDIDPRDEIFNDDPFATCFNCSNDSAVNESKDEQDDYDGSDDNDAVLSQTISIAQTTTLGEVNITPFTSVRALLQLRKNLPIFRRKAKIRPNPSIESQKNNRTNIAPSKRDGSFSSQSNATFNISKLFKFEQENDDELSVSIRSHKSRPKFYFGR